MRRISRLIAAAAFTALPLLSPLFPLAAQTAGSGTASGSGTLQSPPAVSTQSGPETFRFIYKKGDKFRFLSTVHEDVYLNHSLYTHNTEITNRIAFEVTDAAPDSLWGNLKGTFVTAEKPEGSNVALISETYDSEFRRDTLGRYTIDDRYYMPVVRNLPIFPDRALAPGDTWTAPGEERHDLRRVFEIPDPYAIPFDARYKYAGAVQKDGKDLRLITADYTIFYQPGPPRAYASIYPVQVAGFSSQRIYWDPKAGQIDSYEERFKLIFDWSDGSIIEYRGTADAKLTAAELMDREKLAADIADAVKDLDNVVVTPTDEGVMISIENIQFQPNSSKLAQSELDKIAAIAEILKRYKGRDILVAGHTALAGTASARKKLSEERAQAVAEQLIKDGARTASEVQTVGYGAEKPIADNSTAEGMAKNRRVEITILEN